MDRTPQQRRIAEGWRQYRRLLRLMLVITVIAIGVGFLWLYATGTPMRWQFLLAVGFAIAGSLMMSAALMGLVFLSNAIGADDDVGSTFDSED